MLSLDIKNSIENFCNGKLSTHPLMEKSNNGDVSPAEAGKYLATILRLLEHTPIFLHRAVQSATHFNKTELADYFKSKIDEEVGHNTWAENDIDKLTKKFGLGELKPAQALENLLDHLRTSIDENPESYIPYILLAEYTTVLLGPALIENLGKCGVPKEMLTSVDYHVELDKEHVDEGLREIDSLLTADSGPEILRNLGQYQELLDQVFVDVLISDSPDEVH